MASDDRVIMTPESALEHDERCERDDPVDWDSCRCAERAIKERDTLRAENDRLTLAASESARTLQVEIQSLKMRPTDSVVAIMEQTIATLRLERDAERTRYILADAGFGEMNRQNRALQAQVTVLREALMLPLMFHSGGVWTSEKAARWFAITGTTETTTKVMCDTIRKALAALPQDGA